MMRRHLAILVLVFTGSTCGEVHAACDEDIFRKMVEDGKSAEEVVSACTTYLLAPSADSYRILRWVVGSGNAPLTGALLEMGYWPDTPSARDALLFYALEAPSDPVEVVDLLISKGANAEQAASRFDLIYDAIELNHGRTLERLLQVLEADSWLYQERNLFAAVGGGNIDLLSAILDRGADPDFVEDRNKVTPLMVAADRDASDDLLLSLINRGADCWRTDRLGNSSFNYARSTRVSDLLRRSCRAR